MHAFVLSVGNSLPSGRLRETSSGPTPARDGITDSEEPSLQAELKKSFNIGKNNLRRGDNLPKSLKKIKKVSQITSLEAHPPRAYPSFCSMNLLGVSPLQTVPRPGHNPMTLNQEFAKVWLFIPIVSTDLL